jgi:GNAT superfamily N-acetyltransferase
MAVQSPKQEPFAIEEWSAQHPHWSSLLAKIDSWGQTDWVSFTADFHFSTHLLVALKGGEIVGFLRYVAQPIGPDMGCPPMALNDAQLIEAKVLAFAVDGAHQGQGIGRALQQEVIRRAREAGCYQVRSHSSGKNEANHHLKLSMGFAVHPIVRGEDEKGVYFVMPLTNP